MTRALPEGWKASCLAAGIALLSFVPGPGEASAATVEVVETVGTDSTAEFRFVASPGESNRVRVVQREADADRYELEIVDAIATLHAGAGCSGDAMPGTPMTCVLHKPHPSEASCYGKGCVPEFKEGWTTGATFVLGNVGSSLDSSAVTSIDETVSAGPGNDKIVTGGGKDTVDPGRGEDTVSTGAGRDVVDANAVPDGPDSYDLGSGGDSPTYVYQVPEKGDLIDYRDRLGRIELAVDELANDGAPGEEDEVVDAEVIRAGAGDDLLVGGRFTDVFFGGPGDDRLAGRGANDLLSGEAGNDRLIGAAGGDILSDGGRLGGGDDFAVGGRGDDLLYVGPGADRVLGGSGADAIGLGKGGDVSAGGPGDDSIRGGQGNDRLVGNGGADKLFGGRGRDAIVASTVGGGPATRPPTAHGRLDREADSVDCGTEIDVASVNPWDKTKGCERLFSLPPALGTPSHNRRRRNN